MTTEKELTSLLLFISDVLRNENYNGHEITEILSRFLLFKRLSDVFEEEVEAIEQKIGDKMLAWDVPRTHHFFIPTDARWSTLRRLNTEVGRHLYNAMLETENSNSVLEGVFSSLFNGRAGNLRMSEHLATRLILEFSRLSLNNQDLETPSVVGQAYDSFLSRFSSNKVEEFQTPNIISKLLVHLLKPQLGMSICDPTCGAGEFLVECHKAAQIQGESSQEVFLYGQELNFEVWVLARINLLLHNIFHFDIRHGNTISNPQFTHNDQLRKFDLVLCHPPFGVRVSDPAIFKFDRYHRFRFGLPPKSSCDFAFIQHILATLKDTGRAAIVVSNGVLFRGGAEGKIRQGILQADLLEAVIGMPRNLPFQVKVPTAILVFNQNKLQERRDRVLIVDAGDIHQERKRHDSFSEKDIHHISNVYTNFVEESEFSRVVSLDEIVSNNYDLSINRYILPTKVEVNLDREIEKLQNLEAKRTQAEEQVKQILQGFGIKL